MNSPEFDLPRHLSDFSFTGSGFLDWEPGLDETEAEEEVGEVADGMLIFLYDLPDRDKIRVFLDAMKAPKMGRHRKNIYRDLAQAANRPDKEVVALPDEEKARLFRRVLARLEERSASTVMAAALIECYFPAAQKLLEQLDVDPSQALQLFQSVRHAVPDTLWAVALEMVAKEVQLKPRQRAAMDSICAEVENLRRRCPLPFAVHGPPDLIPLEKHLWQLHIKDPATAKPLITGLAQLNATRPENWFLFGLTGVVEGQPEGVLAKAWQLAGEFYRWGDDLATVDQPFDPERLRANADALRVLFTDPTLARARKLVGEYVLRQLVHSGERSLALELLTPELARQYPKILLPLAVIEAQTQALNKDLEKVRALAAKFPDVRELGLLASTLRRSGQFEAAASELRSSKLELAAERALLEAHITDAFELTIPEDRTEQEKFFQRLQPLSSRTEPAVESHPEIGYCRALYQISQKEPSLVAAAYDTLLDLPDRYLAVRAYRFLAALLSRDPVLFETELQEAQARDAEEVLALLPTNLLKVAVRSLTLQPDPENLRAITRFFYDHMPELLDPLLGQEDLLAANPALLERFLDNNDKLSDPIQRWAGCQKAIQLAAPAHEPDLVARAIDSSLSIQDPLLAPYQAKLLQQQMTDCEDLDLKEELAERMALVNAEQAKACLYQLLHVYLGNQRREDAWRMVEALKALNESSDDLDQCVRVLQPNFESGQKAKPVGGKLPFPVSVGFYGGDETDKLRTEQLRQDLMRQHPGLTVQFEHNTWNMKHRTALVDSVEKFDVICASNLMRTDISRGLRQRARELGKVFGFCRNRGLGTISDTITKAVEMHLARKR